MNKGIYALVCKANGKIYVGSSLNFRKRKSTHFSKLKQGVYVKAHPDLQEDYDLYGRGNFKFVIIEEFETDSIDFLLQKETDYIIRFGTFFEDKGYNLSIPSEKIFRKKFIEKYGEEFLKDLIWSSDELLEKEEYFYKKELASKDSSIYKIDINTNEILQEYSHPKFAAEEHNIKLKTLFEVLSGKKKNKLVLSHKGFVWVYKSKYEGGKDYRPSTLRSKTKIILNPRKKKERIKKEIVPYLERNLRRKEISLQNIETGEVKTFISQTEAANFLDIQVSSVGALIKGIKKKGGGGIAKITQWKGWKIYKPEEV